MTKQREPRTYKAIHKSADYFEPLFRARFVRAMKVLQAKVSINDLAMSMGNRRMAQAIIPKAQIAEALKPAAKVVRDAFRRGGVLGATRVQDLAH